jgi:hypothetical protein
LQSAPSTSACKQHTCSHYSARCWLCPPPPHTHTPTHPRPRCLPPRCILLPKETPLLAEVQGLASAVTPGDNRVATGGLQTTQHTATHLLAAAYVLPDRPRARQQA